MKQLILLVLSTAITITQILPHNSKNDLIEKSMQAAITEHKTSSGVVVIAHKGNIIYQKAFGHLVLSPTKIMAKLGSFYDLASLTKLYTATLIMRLHEASMLNVYQPVAQYLEEFNTPDKKMITIAQLLTHYSGLPAINPLSDYAEGATSAIKKIAETPLITPPGKKFLYSDLGPITAGYLAEKITGKRLANLFREYIFTPLKLQQTLTHPSPRFTRNVAAHDKDEEGITIHCRVHDPRAQALGGLAGNAGIFATASDVAKFAQIFFNGKTEKGTQFLSQESISAMTTPQLGQTDSEQRGIGFDINTPFSSLRGNFSPKSFGHTGFTGTSVWIDPTSETVVVLLCNRLHPDGKGDVKELRKSISNLAAKMIN